MGLLSIEPKMADGSPVTDFEQCILRDENGNEIKEWYALASYLERFGEDGLPARYAQSDGRKEVSRSWNPVELVRHMNWLTGVVLAVLVLLLMLVVLLVRHFTYARKLRRYGSSHRGRKFRRR